jgi:hypothetical protein
MATKFFSSRFPVFAALPAGFLSVAACGDAGNDSIGSERVARTEHHVTPPTASHSSRFARQWMTNFANSIKGDTINPPLASRSYAYAAIGIYESVVHGMPGYRSLAGQLNGLDSLPEPDAGVDYDWPTVLAQTMHRIATEVHVYPFNLFFEFTTPARASMAGLGPQQIGYRRVQGVPDATIANSVDYGNRLADVLVAWANADGYATLRFKGFIPPTGPDKWVPTGFSDTDKVANPTEPYFGDLRPLALTDGNECDPGPPPAFSTVPGSEMYEEAKLVYDTEVNLTDEQREIARFWADGPGATATPAGHWIAIVTQRARPSTLDNAAYWYLLPSMAMFDGFIAVWDSKFKYNLLRPETYIRRHIDPTWQPFLPTPQFAEYVSGHSGQSGAAATVLDAIFGGVPWTDSTKLRRGFGSRSFPSYAAAAQEAAVSRLYGGIHYNVSNNRGITLGQCVGNLHLARVDVTL